MPWAAKVEMVRRARPGADCIANLWVEGVDLYKAGHLKLPPGVILVWPDDGAGWIRDQGEVRSGQGIYHHTAMLNGSESQLTEIVPPQRIHQELTRFIKAGTTSYFVVNTSDVRPVPLTTDYCMRLAWSGGSELEKTSAAAEHDCLLQWSRRQFGDADAAGLATLYGDYFATPYIQAGLGENRILHEIKRLVGQVRRAASPRKMPVKLARSTAAKFAPSTAHLADLAPKVRAMAEHVRADRRNFYVGHLVLQVEVHHRLCNVIEALCAAIIAMGENHSRQAIDQLDTALAEYDALIQALRTANMGGGRAFTRASGLLKCSATRCGWKPCAPSSKASRSRWSVPAAAIPKSTTTSSKPRTTIPSSIPSAGVRSRRVKWCKPWPTAPSAICAIRWPSTGAKASC